MRVATEQVAGRLAVTIAGATVASASPLAQRSHEQQPWTLDSGHYLQRTVIYQTFARKGYRYGDSLRLLRWAWVGEDKVLASLLPARSFTLPLSPAIIDAGLQTALLLDSGEGGPGGGWSGLGTLDGRQGRATGVPGGDHLRALPATRKDCTKCDA